MQFKMFGFDGLAQTPPPVAENPWTVPLMIIGMLGVGVLFLSPSIGRCSGLERRWRTLKRRGDNEAADYTRYEAQRADCDWAR